LFYTGGFCVSTSTSISSSKSTTQSSFASSSSQKQTPTPKLPTSSSTTISVTTSCATAAPSPTGAAINSLSVIEFVYTDTEYEPFGDIVKSMCLGMKSRSVTGNQDILTYVGSNDPCYKTRRSQVKCGGCCTSKCGGLFHKIHGSANSMKTCSRTLGPSQDSQPTVTSIHSPRLLREERELTRVALLRLKTACKDMR
jgi:hypothetical protein